MLWVSLLLLIAAPTAFSLDDHQIDGWRTILDRRWTYPGPANRPLPEVPIDVSQGEVVQIVLEQSGIDLYLRLALGGRSLGSYDSLTGRYGQDRIQLKVPQTGQLVVSVAVLRSPKVTGSLHLLVQEIPALDEGDSSFTAASRMDRPMIPARRVESFEAAATKLSAQGRQQEGGLAAFAALNLLIETSSDAARAVADGEMAVSALGQGGNDLLLAAATNGLAVARGEFKRGLKDEELRTASALVDQEFETANELYEKAGSAIGQAEVTLFKSALVMNAGVLEEPLKVFDSLALRCAELHEAVCEALARMNAAVAQRDLGDCPACFDTFNFALRLASRDVDTAIRAQIIDNMAFAMRMRGDFDGAIFHHERAMQLYSTYGECSGVSRSLYGLGFSLLGVGDSSQALRYYKLALGRSCLATSVAVAPDSTQVASTTVKDLCDQASKAVKSHVDDRDIASWIAWDLGNLARAQSDPASAFSCHQVASRLVTSPGRLLGTKFDSVLDLIQMGLIAKAQRIYQEANSLAGKAAKPGPSPWYLAQGAEVRAQLLAALGKTDAALEAYGVASKEYGEVSNAEGAFSAESRRASLAAAIQSPQATHYFEAADLALEKVRLLSLDPLFSANLFASGRRIYEEWIEAESTKSQDPYAIATATLAISERSRARLLAQMARAFQIGQDARKAQIRSAATGAAAVVDASTSADSVRQLQSSTVETEPVSMEQDLGLESSRFDGASLKASIERLEAYRQKLGDDTTVVEYLLGEHRSYAWVIRRDALYRVDLGPAAAIRAEVVEARDVLINGRADESVRRSQGRLYDLLWRPLNLSTTFARFQIVPDDELHEVAFAALWDTTHSEYLVQRASVKLLPSIQFAASRAAKDSGSAKASMALLVGDPVYELPDARERCSASEKSPEQRKQSTNLKRIAGSGDEINAIDRLFISHRDAADVLTGCLATRNRILESGPQKYRFIHFAAHATADRVLPQRSAIYLSEWDEKGLPTVPALTAADLLEHPIGSELVVLSGCSTAGGGQLSGEGSLGLPFSLIASGSRQVISTLWQVADTAGVVAMTRLYEGLLARGEPVDIALQSAQLEMLKGGSWRHPRYWAVYSLLGI